VEAISAPDDDAIHSLSVYRFANAAQAMLWRCIRSFRLMSDACARPKVEKPRRGARAIARKPSERMRAPGVWGL